MQLPDSYTLKPNAIPAYFDAMLGAQPPERFSVKFIENLGFTSTNDRLFIGILKDLGFLNRDGAPQPRYFEFLDESKSKHVVATGIKEAFADLFAINIRANDLTVDEVKNKLRTMYMGKKTDLVIGNVAKTFKALCDYADFSTSSVLTGATAKPSIPLPETETPEEGVHPAVSNNPNDTALARKQLPRAQLAVSGLQYHINIVLPDTKDQGVYDAIFKSLRDHLG